MKKIRFKEYVTVSRKGVNSSNVQTKRLTSRQITANLASQGKGEDV